jgi:hypothetical protein
MEKLQYLTLDKFYQNFGKSKFIGYEDSLNQINVRINDIEQELVHDNNLMKGKSAIVQDLDKKLVEFLDQYKVLIKKVNMYMVVQMMNAQGNFEMIDAFALDQEDDPSIVTEDSPRAQDPRNFQ